MLDEDALAIVHLPIVHLPVGVHQPALEQVETALEEGGVHLRRIPRQLGMFPAERVPTLGRVAHQVEVSDEETAGDLVLPGAVNR